MDKEKVYLKQARLVNFQSWKDSTIDLTSGLNLLIAENGVGKSSFLRAMRIVLSPEKYTKDARRKYIRWGTEFATVAYIFSDDTIFLIQIYVNGNAYYKLFLDGTKKFLGNEPPIELIDKLGIVKYESIVGNVIDLSKEKFLVNSSEADDDTIFKMVLSNEDLDKLRQVISEEKIPEVVYKLGIEKERLKYTEDLISKIQYIDISNLERNVKASDIVVNNIEGLVKLCDILEETPNVQTIPYDSKQTIENIEPYIKLKNTLDMLDSIKFVSDCDCDTLKGLQPIITFNDEINKLKYQKDLSNLDNTLENISSLVNLLNVEPIRPVNITLGSINTLMVLNRLAINCNSVIDLMRTQSMIESEKKELDNLGGEEFDCPIYGKIKLVNEDCIPVHI